MSRWGVWILARGGGERERADKDVEKRADKDVERRRAIVKTGKIQSL